jgi:hypothetical protein
MLVLVRTDFSITQCEYINGILRLTMIFRTTHSGVIPGQILVSHLTTTPS